MYINSNTQSSQPQADRFTLEIKVDSPEPHNIAIQIGKADLEGKKHPEKEKMGTKDDQNQAKAKIRAKLMMALRAIVNTAVNTFLAFLGR